MDLRIRGPGCVERRIPRIRVYPGFGYTRDPGTPGKPWTPVHPRCGNTQDSGLPVSRVYQGSGYTPDPGIPGTIVHPGSVSTQDSCISGSRIYPGPGLPIEGRPFRRPSQSTLGQDPRCMAHFAARHVQQLMAEHSCICMMQFASSQLYSKKGD